MVWDAATQGVFSVRKCLFNGRGTVFDRSNAPVGTIFEPSWIQGSSADNGDRDVTLINTSFSSFWLSERCEWIRRAEKIGPPFLFGVAGPRGNEQRYVAAQPSPGA
jgi:hypothetical protein